MLNTFTYNGDSFRVQRQDSSGTSKQVWDDQKIVEETDHNNVVQVIYTQSNDEYGNVVSQRRSGASRYFQFDPLGSTARLTDGVQNVTDSYIFKAFGESLLAAGPTINPFQYVGMSGYYLDPDIAGNWIRLREYVSLIKRFLSADPSNVLSEHATYKYSSNNPVRLTDASGLGATCCPHIVAICLKNTRQTWQSLAAFPNLGIGVGFTLFAQFSDGVSASPTSGGCCCCACCAVRQVVKGYAFVNGKPKETKTGGGLPVNPDLFNDDGYRNDGGCEYSDTDDAGFPAAIPDSWNLDTYQEFRLRIYDVCGAIADQGCSTDLCADIQNQAAQLRQGVAPGTLVYESGPYYVRLTGKVTKGPDGRILRTIQYGGFGQPGNYPCPYVVQHYPPLPPFVIDPSQYSK